MDAFADKHEFKVGEHTYRIRQRMSPKNGRKVMKRFLPVLGPLLDMQSAQNIDAIKKLLTSLGEIDDTADDFIADRCLELIDRKQGEAWAPIKTKGSDDLMFQDVDYADTYVIIAEVIKEEILVPLMKARGHLAQAGNPLM